MESEPHMPLDLYNRMPVVMDGTSPQLLSESHLHSMFLSSHSDRFIGLQVGQSFRDLQPDKVVSFDGLVNRNNMNYQELCLGGTHFESGSLGTLLASINFSDNAISNSVVPLQDVSSESLQVMHSNGGSYASNSLIPASSNCGYNGLVGDLNNKWDQNRFLMQPELNWRTSTSGTETVQFNESQNATEWNLPSSNVCSSHAYGSTRSYNELSLSLVTSGQSLPCTGSIQDQCCDMSYSHLIHNSQSQARIGSEYTLSSRHSQNNKELSLGCAWSCSPQFTEIKSGSRYRSVFQQILTEIASFSLDGVDKTSYSTAGNLVNSSSNHLFSSNYLEGPHNSLKATDESYENDGSIEVSAGCSSTKWEPESKKSQLLSLLQMVDDRYNQCLDQMHTVISAFHAATELDPQLHARFALQSVSIFYKDLRERISNQILALGMEGEVSGESRRSFEKSFIQKQWALQQLKRKDQQLWRPQRGLPERSVSVLRQWMFDNFLHPYPNDAEKHLLAIKSGLTRSQVSNWFINARVRLWKPLVEEMCAELNARKGSRHLDHEGSLNGNNGSRSSQLSICDFNHRLNS